MAFAPDGATLASGSDDHTVRLWRMVDWSPLRTLPGTRPGESVAFAPDGATLASGSRGQTVRLWRVADWSPLHTLRAQEPVTSMAFGAGRGDAGLGVGRPHRPAVAGGGRASSLAPLCRGTWTEVTERGVRVGRGDAGLGVEATIFSPALAGGGREPPAHPGGAHELGA